MSRPFKCTNLACRYYGETVCRCYPWMQDKPERAYYSDREGNIRHQGDGGVDDPIRDS